MFKLSKLPLELLYIICEYLDTDDLLVLARLNKWYNYHLAMLLSERIDPKDADMKEVPINKERNTTYNIYTNEDRLRYFFYLHKKLLKPAEAAKLANVNPETARKWK
jgi:hypothetical protein